MRAGGGRLSVTVLNYNYGHFLDQCLASILCQSFTDFEVIVIDNSGSGRVQASGARVRVIANDRNVGFGAGVNIGFQRKPFGGGASRTT